ncbi:organic cation transporter protein-like [Anneissia japonica]|uniref:organic cation transporter protein-like n=1 Tax=Anneissia japonica TaxID=1529436 RepID=UPI0014259FF5|nr:organic cation transporter protein-like [Anneissia japonica]
MKFDGVFKYTGKYGRYHRQITHIVCLVIITNTFTNISTVFLNGTMDHFCKDTDNTTNTNCSASDYEFGIANNILPPDDKNTPFINETMCRMYTGDVDGVNNNETELASCEHGWTYDRSMYRSTIVSEFDLVCEDSYKVSLAASSFLFGYFFGSIVFGGICDYFGRKRGILIALALKILMGTLCAIAPSYWTYFVFRLLNGTMNIGLYISVFVYVTEFVAPSKRAMISAIAYVYWSIGFLFLAGIAYFVRSWRTFYLIVSLSPAPLLIVYLFIPESPRWLLLKNRPKEAKKILQKIAKVNKKNFPDDVVDNIEVQNNPQRELKRASFVSIFRFSNMRKKTLILIYCWLTTTLVYYGLTYGVESLNLNIYIATSLGGVTELLATFFTWFAIQRFGRRWMLVFFFNAAGILCFLIIWIPTHMEALRTALSMAGRFFVTSTFSLIYTFTCELYSTDVRSIGLGICSFMSRVAGVLAPQLLFLEKLWTPLPLVTFSAASVSAGILAILLPETLNFPLPQTVEEAELVTRQTNQRLSAKDFHELSVKPEQP